MKRDAVRARVRQAGTVRCASADALSDEAESDGSGEPKMRDVSSRAV